MQWQNGKNADCSNRYESCSRPPIPRRFRWKITAFRISVLFGLFAIILVHIYMHSKGIIKSGHTDPTDLFRFFEIGHLRPGAILLIVWLISIPLFGRIGCGWFCHMGAWQELFDWLCRRFPSYRKRKMLHAKILPWVIPSLILAAYFIHVFWVWHTKGFPTRFTTEPFDEISPWDTNFEDTIMLFTFFVFFPTLLIGLRAICRYTCPFLMLFRPLQKLSLWRVRKTGECDDCEICSAYCRMGLDVMNEIQSLGEVAHVDCVRCLTCVDVCPQRALRYTRKKNPAFAHIQDARVYNRNFMPLKMELFLLIFVGLAMLADLSVLPGIMPLSLVVGIVAYALLKLVRRVRSIDRAVRKVERAFGRWLFRLKPAQMEVAERSDTQS